MIATTATEDFLKELNLLGRFKAILQVPRLNTTETIVIVLEETGVFSTSELNQLRQQLNRNTYK